MPRTTKETPEDSVHIYYSAELNQIVLMYLASYMPVAASGIGTIGYTRTCINGWLRKDKRFTFIGLV